MRVPFVDLKAQYESLKPEVDAVIAEVVSGTAFISGRFANAFEDAFAQYLGVEHCIAVANGTDAIEIALAAMGIGAGDEVIVPANTFFATAEAVSNVGATPVFVDNEGGSFNIDHRQIKGKITTKTSAIIAVHLYGLPAEMDAIMAIAQENGLKVLEDCAQAHGAAYRGRKVGTFGDAASFSFYPSKNLGAYGDAGAIVTNDAETANRARLIANHGEASKNYHSRVGRNSRMDGIQAAVLSVKLPHLDSWLEARRAHASKYSELLRDRLAVPDAPKHSTHTYHLYVVVVPDGREQIIERLREAGIDTGIHYPTPIPFTEAYAHLGYQPSDFPCAYDLKDNLLSLPMYPELTEEMIRYVCETLLAALPRPKAATE
jgi:dTDP-4-amino-4,6-dideoxygalactose transaminase